MESEDNDNKLNINKKTKTSESEFSNKIKKTKLLIPSKKLDTSNKSSHSEHSSSSDDKEEKEVNNSIEFKDKKQKYLSNMNCIHEIDSKKIFKNDIIEKEVEETVEKNEINKINKI